MLYLKVEATMLVRIGVGELISTRAVGLRIEDERMMELVMHPLQNTATIRARDVYEELKITGQLSFCLSEKDGMEITSARGLSAYGFRKNFGDVSLIMWRTPHKCENPKEPVVPFLSVRNEKVVLNDVKMSTIIGNAHLTPRIFERKLLTGGFA
jgi:hypothetical protein